MTVVSSEAKDDKIWFKLHKLIGMSEDLSVSLIYLPPESKQHSRANITKIYTTTMQARESGPVLNGDLNARTGELREAASLMSGIPIHIQPATEFYPLGLAWIQKRVSSFQGKLLSSSATQLIWSLPMVEPKVTLQAPSPTIRPPGAMMGWAARV
jgi:hypothetical protein